MAQALRLLYATAFFVRKNRKAEKGKNMKRFIILLSLIMLASICLAQTPAHPNWVTFTRTSPTTGAIRWSSEPSANVDYYYFGLHPTTTQYFAPAYCDPNWNVPGGWAASQTLESPGVYITNVGALDPTKEYYAYVAAVETGGWTWSAYSSWEPPIVTYDYPEGVLSPIYPEVSLQMITGNANNGLGHPPTAPLNPSFVAGRIQIFDLVGPGPWDMLFSTSFDWVWVVGIGVFTGGPIANVHIPANKNLEIEVQFGNGGDPTLPVELSYFAATLTAQNYVKLTWISQSETGLLGYRVYRSDTSEQADAVNITPSLIEATNTSTTQTYNHTDEEVVIGNTYYYWLESVDMGHSDFHGPVNVLVTGETPPIPPEYTEITSMRDAYPNPFGIGESTCIDAYLKAGEKGQVTIYNVLGQTVKSYSISEGRHLLTWDGKDSKGLYCGSGIYFYKLSTPSLNQTKKMVIIK